MDVSDLKKNVKLKIDGSPWVVVDYTFVKPGKGQGLYKCKIKNMLTGSVVDRTWRSGEKLEAADVEQRDHSFLYASGENYTFMDTASYEQVELRDEMVGGDKDFLLDELQVEILFYEGRAVGMSLPAHVTMEITECPDGVAGNTANGATKDATMATGLVLQVPLFIKKGERIKVDTRNRAYVERVNN